MGAVVTRLVPDEGPPANITAFEGLTKDEQRILVSASLSFLVGLFQVHQPSSHYKTMIVFNHTNAYLRSICFQLGMGLLQVGFIVMYLSDTLISGFTTAAAVHILISQLKFVLGLTVPGFSGPLSLIHVGHKTFFLLLVAMIDLLNLPKSLIISTLQKL